MKEKPKTIAVGMSGGIDSSVAAYLLKKQGHNVIGVSMKIWDGPVFSNGYPRSGCYGPGEDADIETAKKTANKIGIPFYVINLQEEYKQTVLEYFRSEYLRGKTPNPCVLCNQKIKFGLLLDKALQSGISFNFFATGHYAIIEQNNGRSILKKSADSKKDQTYFLYRLKPDQLNKILFPLGNFRKDQVRKMALEFGLQDLAEKPESQDFFEGDSYTSFFRNSNVEPGDIVDISGRILGRHTGIINYTIGQRKGLKIGGLKEPLYVTGIDSLHNQIIVGPYESLFAKGLVAGHLNWLSVPAPAAAIKVSAKIRLHQPDKPCQVTPIDTNQVRVAFEESQMSITPGQSIVFYDGDVVAGGGIIQQSLN